MLVRMCDRCSSIIPQKENVYKLKLYESDYDSGAEKRNTEETDNKEFCEGCINKLLAFLKNTLAMEPSVDPDVEPEKEMTDLPARKKKMMIEELVKAGFTNKAIAEKTGFPYATVYNYTREIRKFAPGEKDEKIKPGYNSDRHKCRTCMFKGKGREGGCDYVSINRHSRGCSVSDCNVYERAEDS